MKNQQYFLILLLLIMIYSVSSVKTKNTLKTVLGIKEWKSFISTVNNIKTKAYFPSRDLTQLQCQETLKKLEKCFKNNSLDILVCTAKMIYWFIIKSDDSDRKEIKTGGGMLLGMFEVIKETVKINNQDIIVFKPKEVINPDSTSCNYFNFLNNNGIQLAGIYKGSDKPITDLIFSNASTKASETSESGFKLSSTEGGNYSGNGLKLEFTGLIKNIKDFKDQDGVIDFTKIAGGVFETNEDTDPSGGSASKTYYTLTYRIPIDKSELSYRFQMKYLAAVPGTGSMPINQLTVKLNYNIKKTGKTIIKEDNNKEKPVDYTLVASPVLITNKTKLESIDKGSVACLNSVDINRDFSNSFLSNVYFYDIKGGESVSLKTPEGKNQLIGVGSPLYEIPYLLVYTDNDVLSDASVDEYHYLITKSDTGFDFSYNLLSSQSFSLNETNLFVIGQRIKVLDAGNVYHN